MKNNDLPLITYWAINLLKNSKQYIRVSNNILEYWHLKLLEIWGKISSECNNPYIRGV